MRAKPRRAAPRVEALEGRTLLSAGELLVRFTQGVPSRPARLALRDLGAAIVRSHEDGPSVVRLPEGADAADAASILNSTRGVQYAEPDGRIRAAAAIPFDDPELGQLWGLDSPNDIDIDAPEAWSIEVGRPETVVAVIDTGLDIHHPDLAGKVWTNPNEVAFNGLDDDRDGHIDDVFGWDFLAETPFVNDNDGHGTHVAGTIAAVADNGVGIAGVAPGVRIMPLKFIGAFGDGAISDAVEAIYYAVRHGAKVINASWSGVESSQALADAIRFAGANNVVFVTAAGNESANNDVVPSYPPSIRLPNLLSVAAIDPAGNLASFSNYGSRTVDLAAPGVGILSTVPGGGYARYSGTSMATPHVAGVVALAASRFPHLTGPQLVQWVKGTAKPAASLAGRTVSGGIVSAFNALAGITPQQVANEVPPAASVAPSPTLSISAGTLAEDDARATVLGSDFYFRLNGATNRAFLTALYRDVLGTRPDRAGQNLYLRQLRQGRTRQQVARALLGGAAARRAKVAGWMLADFGGTASAASLSKRSDVAGWATLLSAGLPDADVHAAILGSAAYWSAAGGTAEGSVAALYLRVLGRPADPEGLTLHAARVRAGLPLQTIARELLATPEAKQVEVARWYQRDLRWPWPVADLKNHPEIAALAAQLRA